MVGIDRLSLAGANSRSHVAAAELATIDHLPTTIKHFAAVLAEPAMPRSDRFRSMPTAAYALGLALMLTRVCVGLSIGRRLRRASTPIDDPATLELVRRHAARLALHVVPAIASCSRVSVPVVVGMLRPMILLPASLASGLTGRQLEYVLLHELAHIHRYDMLANLLQRLIESGLFFHPAVWWLTRQVSIERENACDDAVLRAGCQRAAYAEASAAGGRIVRSFPARAVSPAGLLAATGENPSQLARRIHRLFNVEQPAAVRPATPAILLLLFGAASVIALTASHSPATADVAVDPATVEQDAQRSPARIGSKTGKHTSSFARGGSPTSRSASLPAKSARSLRPKPTSCATRTRSLRRTVRCSILRFGIRWPASSCPAKKRFVRGRGGATSDWPVSISIPFRVISASRLPTP